MKSLQGSTNSENAPAAADINTNTNTNTINNNQHPPNTSQQLEQRHDDGMASFIADKIGMLEHRHLTEYPSVTSTSTTAPAVWPATPATTSEPSALFMSNNETDGNNSIQPSLLLSHRFTDADNRAAVRFFKTYYSQLTSLKSMVRIGRAYLGDKSRTGELPIVLHVLEAWCHCILRLLVEEGINSSSSGDDEKCDVTAPAAVNTSAIIQPRAASSGQTVFGAMGASTSSSSEDISGRPSHHNHNHQSVHHKHKKRKTRFSQSQFAERAAALANENDDDGADEDPASSMTAMGVASSMDTSGGDESSSYNSNSHGDEDLDEDMDLNYVDEEDEVDEETINYPARPATSHMPPAATSSAKNSERLHGASGSSTDSSSSGSSMMQNGSNNGGSTSNTSKMTSSDDSNSLSSKDDISKGHNAQLSDSDKSSSFVGSSASSSFSPPKLVDEHSSGLHGNIDVDPNTSIETIIMNHIRKLPQNQLQYIAIEGYLVAGCIAYALGDFNRAMDLNSQILKLSPRHVQGLSNVAIVCRVLNRVDDAERYWRQVVELRPTYWDAIEQLISLLTMQKRLKEALDLISPVLAKISVQKLRSPDDWSRFLSLYHTLGNLQSSMGLYIDAAKTFATVALMACQMGDCRELGVGSQTDLGVHGIPDLVTSINRSVLVSVQDTTGSILVHPHKALDCKYYLFSPSGNVPFPPELMADDEGSISSSSLSSASGTSSVDKAGTSSSSLSTSSGSSGSASESSTSSPPGAAAPSTLAAVNSLAIVLSNALLNLAKILQDGINSGIPSKIVYLNGKVPSHEDILSLYLLSLSLNPSPSTANNVGILLASLGAAAAAAAAAAAGHGQGTPQQSQQSENDTAAVVTGGSAAGKKSAAAATIAADDTRNLALEYYRYGLSLDANHPHLYTNLGSLLREQGDINEAIRMYQQAVKCDPNFNIALANLASALKDQGHVDQAVVYYRRAVEVSPNFVEALSGLANCQGTVCDWVGRGGYGWEPISVDDNGDLIQGQIPGWLSKVIGIIDKQVEDGRMWGIGAIQFAASVGNGVLFREIENALGGFSDYQRGQWSKVWSGWQGKRDEGSNVLSMIEKSMRVCQRRWYIDRLRGMEQGNPAIAYTRPKIPAVLPVPLATSILPFHAFTLPFSALQTKSISERSAIRVSMQTLTQSWLPDSVYPPPPPPQISDDGYPILHVGYVSSDFINHPLSHLMQSVFAMHNRARVIPYCYATSPSDGSPYRERIEQGSVFKDVSAMSTQQIAEQIIADGIHVLVNLNGFTRGARNEIFALRVCPIQMVLMGFAGPIASDWCDYVLGDSVAMGGDNSVYKERIIYMPRSFFCCDHRQSAHDSDLVRRTNQKQLHTWDAELQLRQELRAKMFPQIPSDAFLMGNFNQLYKIDPTTLRNWLAILHRLPNAYLWLLQFPKSGQGNLVKFADKWSRTLYGDAAAEDISKRIVFTTVAEKDLHIFRSRVCDLFLDTPECNAHTTAADVMWTGTPIVTFPRHEHKLCSRIAASVVHAAFPNTPEGEQMAQRCVAGSEPEYQDIVCDLAQHPDQLMEMRRVLWNEREKGDFFNTQSWVENVEKGYQTGWNDWLEGRHEDVYIQG